MIFRTLSRLAMGMIVGKVVSKGIGYASRRGKNPVLMTPAERERAIKTQKMANRARKIASIARRIR